MENRGKLKAMFIIPSAIGVILFMIPVKNAAGGHYCRCDQWIPADFERGDRDDLRCDDARGAGKAQVHHGKPRT